MHCRREQGPVMLSMLAARLLVFGISVTCLCGEAKQRERCRLKGDLGTGIFEVAGPDRCMYLSGVAAVLFLLYSQRRTVSRLHLFR
jgi:hypothetical protein